METVGGVFALLQKVIVCDLESVVQCAVCECVFLCVLVGAWDAVRQSRRRGS